MGRKHQPVCWIIAGPNGAGKTTFAMDYLPRMANCENFINADLIAAGLSPLAPGGKSVAAGRIFLLEISRNIDRRRDFGFETTLSGLSYRRLIRELRSKGWRVELIYLALPSLNLASRRVAERLIHGGHSIPHDILKRRFFRSINNLFDVYAALPDRLVCYCNADAAPVLVFTQCGAKRTVIDPELLKQLEDLGSDGF